MNAQPKLADDIEHYEVGNAAGNVIEQPTVNIGYSGVVGAGKSAIINRTNAAVKGAFEELSKEVGMPDARQADPGPLVEHKLTEHINLVEVRMMKDFDQADIDKLLDTIQGKPPPGQSTGIQIHCPVFVYYYEKRTSDLATSFLSEIAKRVNDIYGRKIMVAVILKEVTEESAEALRIEISQTTDIPLDNIRVFEWSSPEDAVTKQRDEMLRFTWECLKMGELNIQFWEQNEKKKRQQVEKRKRDAVIAASVLGPAAIGGGIGAFLGPVGFLVGAAVGTAVGTATILAKKAAYRTSEEKPE